MSDRGAGTIEVLLVDDHPIVRDGIKSLLAEVPHVSVTGEATDGHEAVERAGALNPDVVIMDIGLPTLNGLEATKLLLEEAPHARVIVLTVYDNKEYVLQALQVGARGYIIKNTPSDELVRAIETVHRGALYFPENVSSMIVEQFVENEAEDRAELTRRERQVLGLIAEGHSNRDLADRLKLSVRTIETHREHIMRKLDIHSVAGLTGID